MHLNCVLGKSIFRGFIGSGGMYDWLQKSNFLVTASLAYIHHAFSGFM
jgi:hypothetical protein